MSSQPQASPGPPPFARIMQLATGYQISQALHVVAQLGVADFLKDGPQSAEELAKATHTNADALYRILRALASLEVFAEAGPRRFALTPLSESLRSDVPGSLRYLVLFIADNMHWAVFQNLEHSVQTGQPAFDHVFGQKVFEYLGERPRESLLFDQAMAALSGSIGPAVAEAYDFSEFQTITDVGGGNGALLAAILNEHSRPRGILFDLPHAIEHARAAGLLPAGRSELAVGDFFESIPAGADAYVFKSIIHDWPDDKARTILQICRRAISSTGKLLLVEMLIPPDGSPDFSKFLDLEMLAIASGRERTEDEFRQLLASAGFRLDRIVPTRSSFLIIEGSPV